MMATPSGNVSKTCRVFRAFAFDVLRLQLQVDALELARSLLEVLVCLRQ
jgi:hypothetical protein